jgi:hypothetical protein
MPAGQRRRRRLIRGNTHASKRFLTNPVYSTGSHPQPQREVAAQMTIRTTLLLAALLCFGGVALRAQPDDANRQLAREIFKQLIEINTTDSIGSTTVAAEAMAQRLRDAGFPASDVQVRAPARLRRETADPADRPSRRGRSAPRGMVRGSFPIPRARRLFLWPRHAGHEIRRRDFRGHADSLS